MNVIKLDKYRNPGNGAREAMMELLQENDILQAKDISAATDIILSYLWVLGFKIVPLDGTER